MGFKYKLKASQTHSIYQYKKLKIKLVKYNADIFFNEQFLIKNIIPNYENIKDPIGTVKECTLINNIIL